MGRWSRAVGEKFIAWVDAPQNASWLDVGCGTGAFTALILERGAPAKVIGIDPSPQHVAHARTAVSAPNVDFRQGSVMDLPFRASQFDIVVSALVIHFVPDRGTAFRALPPASDGTVTHASRATAFKARKTSRSRESS